jgi:hypothetical protein
LRAQLLDHARALGLAGDEEATESLQGSAPSRPAVATAPVQLEHYRRTRRAQ